MRSRPQPASVGLRREAVARQGRNHDVEGVLGPAAEPRGIGQRADQFDLLEDRSGPPVRDQHRQGVRMPGPDVDEVDVDPVDPGRELRVGVQLRLGLPPVVAGGPVADQFLEQRERRTLRSIGDRLLVGPAGRGETPLQVGEVGRGHVDAEWADRRVVRRACGGCRHDDERLSLLDDVGGELRAGAAADVLRRVDRSRRNEQDAAGLECHRRLAVDLVLQRAFQHVDDLFAGMRVPAELDSGVQLDAHLNDFASGDAQIVPLKIDPPDARRRPLRDGHCRGAADHEASRRHDRRRADERGHRSLTAGWRRRGACQPQPPPPTSCLRRAPRRRPRTNPTSDASAPSARTGRAPARRPSTAPSASPRPGC